MALTCFTKTWHCQPQVQATNRFLRRSLKSAFGESRFAGEPLLFCWLSYGEV